MSEASAKRLAEAVGREMLTQDKASRALGMVVEDVAPGAARLCMAVRDDMVNGHDLCHGGLIFTLADSALAYASNARNHVVVAAAAEIQFVSPARRGETLVATARERAATGSTGIYDIEVAERGSGRLVALFRGRTHRLRGSIIDEKHA